MENSSRTYQIVSGNSLGVHTETYKIQDLLKTNSNDEIIYTLIENLGIDSILDLKIGQTSSCRLRDSLNHILILRVK